MCCMPARCSFMYTIFLLYIVHYHRLRLIEWTAAARHLYNKHSSIVHIYICMFSMYEWNAHAVNVFYVRVLYSFSIIWPVEKCHVRCVCAVCTEHDSCLLLIYKSIMLYFRFLLNQIERSSAFCSFVCFHFPSCMDWMKTTKQQNTMRWAPKCFPAFYHLFWGNSIHRFFL